MTQQTSPNPSFGAPVPPYGPPGAPYAPPTLAYGPPMAGFGQPPAPRRRTGAVVAAVVAAVLVLGGLAVGALLLFGTKTLDTAQAERQIAQVTEDQAGVAPTDVSCPADVEARAGAAFTCTASLDDQPISFTVTQTDGDGHIRMDGDNTFVDVATVEDSLDEQFSASTGVEVVSTCDTGGHAVLVDGVGTPIPCTVTNAAAPSDSVGVTATVDEHGTVSYVVQ
jgi:uncharacterized protein DUF4333